MHGGNAAEGYADGSHRVPIHVERDGGRGQREGIALAVANLGVDRTAGPRASGNDIGGDQLARREVGLYVRCLARQPVQIGERQGPRAFRAEHLDDGIERDQRLREVARIAGDTCFAGAQYRVQPIEPADRGAARARVALVTLRVARIAEMLHRVRCNAFRQAMPCCATARWLPTPATRRSPDIGEGCRRLPRHRPSGPARRGEGLPARSRCGRTGRRRAE